MRTAIRKHLRDFVALALLAVVGVGTGVYILSEQGFRFPYFDPERVEFRAEITDAGGVKPGQNQAVRIAFVRVGEITDVQLEDGRAVLKLAIEPEYADRIKQDATALLRPKTGLEDMFLDVDPGTERAQSADEGFTIPVQNTQPDVDSEEFLNVLDRDTRDYLKLLINGAGGGLDGHGRDLRRVLQRLAPLHRDVARVNRIFAEQRGKVRRLVSNYGELVARLGREDRDLVRFVRASEAALGAFAQEERGVSESVARLPRTLRQTERTLAKVNRFAGELGPGIQAIRPAFRELDETNAALRELARSSTGVIRDDIRPFVRIAGPYLDDVRPAATRLNRAMPDLRRTFGELNRFFNMLAFNPNGREPLTGDAAEDADREEGYLFWLAWLAHNTNSLFSTSDASGPFRRANFGVSCQTLRELLTLNPLAETVLGVTDILDATVDQVEPGLGGILPGGSLGGTVDGAVEELGGVCPREGGG